MEVVRVDGYTDERFSRVVLQQHGAFLADGICCEVEIIDRDTAVVRGEPAAFPAVIDTFRFYAEHICRFVDARGATIAEFPPVALFEVPIARIQPSQFYVDRDKLAAARGYVRSPEDVILPLAPLGDGFAALDGHTRLVLALELGFSSVRGFVTQSEDWLWTFVRAAQARGVRSARDIRVVEHEAYEILWNRYCDAVFAGEAP